MDIVIKKFGGTSVATPESRQKVVDIIKTGIENQEQIIVVVSAMGRYGAPYATDTLLGLINHEINQIADREIDMLVSVGETISAVVMSYYLNKCGIKATALTGGGAGIVTNNDFMRAEVIHIDQTAIRPLLDQGIVPVIAGFQGKTVDNNITTIGRGGSDTTASLIGEAFAAKAIEIYTDVDGIMTADPKYCLNAKTLENVSYEEVFQMATSGAKVIHRSAVEVARRSGIPLVIKNTFSNHSGTYIMNYNKLNKVNTIEDKLIASIACRENRIQFSVSGKIDEDRFFKALADNHVSIDIINIFPAYRVFTTESDNKDKVIEVINRFEASYQYIDDCAKVTVIGEKMTGVPGVVSKIVHSLQAHNIEILQTADSLSTIACLVHKKDLKKAVEALHKIFELE